MPAIATASRPELCQIYTKHAGRRKGKRVTGWHKERPRGLYAVVVLVGFCDSSPFPVTSACIHALRLFLLHLFFDFFYFFFLVPLSYSNRGENLNQKTNAIVPGLS